MSYLDRKNRVEVIARFLPPLSYADAITKLQTTAQWVLDNFGEGGDPQAKKVEDYIGFVNAPVQGPYLQCLVSPAYCTALQYMHDNGMAPEGLELLEIRWKDKVPETGWQEWTWTEDVTLEDGTVQAVARSVGRIS